MSGGRLRSCGRDKQDSSSSFFFSCPENPSRRLWEHRTDGGAGNGGDDGERQNENKNSKERKKRKEEEKGDNRFSTERKILHPPLPLRPVLTLRPSLFFFFTSRGKGQEMTTRTDRGIDSLLRWRNLKEMTKGKTKKEKGEKREKKGKKGGSTCITTWGMPSERSLSWDGYRPGRYSKPRGDTIREAREVESTNHSIVDGDGSSPIIHTRRAGAYAISRGSEALSFFPLPPLENWKRGGRGKEGGGRKKGKGGKERK